MKDLYESHRKARSSQPNVVFIMGDDVGWADVPWNNRELRLVFENINNSTGLQLSKSTMKNKDLHCFLEKNPKTATR